MAAYRGKARYHLLSEMSWNSDATNSSRNTVAGVLDVVAGHSRDEADIVRAEVPLSGPFPRRGTRSYDPSP